MNTLADAIDGEWPLKDPAQVDLWENVISDCLAEQVAIEPTEFVKWIEDEGWAKDDAPAIAERFFDDSATLVKWMDRLAR